MTLQLVRPIPSIREQDCVIQTYKDISRHFANTRAYTWACVEKCRKELLPGSLVVEVGCGNGKNTSYINQRPDVVAIGCDIIPYFAESTVTKGSDCSIATNLQLPYRSFTSDMTLSIAVVHHFDSSERRRQALAELLRITRVGGRVVVLVWAKEQPPSSRRKFIQGDNLVPWYSPDKKMVRQRFYHVFMENELQGLLGEINDFRENFKYIDSWYEVGNWVTYIERVS